MYRIALTALLTLALASPAAAKEIEQVEACGAGGKCHTVKTPGDAAYGLVPEIGIPEPAPYYRLGVGFGDGSGEVFDTIEVLYAPSLGMIANDEPEPMWVPVNADARAVADKLTEGIEPLPAEDMPVAGLPEARVDEIVTPAAAAATTGGGGPPWAVLAGAVVAGLGAALLLVRPARRRAASKAARRAFQPPSPGRG